MVLRKLLRETLLINVKRAKMLMLLQYFHFKGEIGKLLNFVQNTIHAFVLTSMEINSMTTVDA